MERSYQSQNKRSGGSNNFIRLEKFARFNIAVITKRGDHGESLIRELQKTRANILHTWPVPEEIPTDFDIVYCDLVKDLPTRIKGLPGEPHVALVAVIQASGSIDIEALENSVPHGVIHLPCTPNSVIASLVTARNQFQYERRLRQRIAKLDENLRSMKTIERAKVIMMQSNKISEDDAYKLLRLTAMERRVTVGALASAIVNSRDLIR